MAVASLNELFGMKCAAITQRSASRDYLDIHALITKAQLPLAQGIATAQAIYGKEFVPTSALYALSYFKDLPKPLSDRVQRDLLAAVQSVPLESIPQLAATAKIGAATPPAPARLPMVPDPEKSLADVARSVNWYTPPARVLANLNLFLCEVMARGTLTDILVVHTHHPWEAFQEAYAHAPPGLYTPRAWAYWGLKLLGDTQALPLPQRFPGKPFDWRRR